MSSSSTDMGLLVDTPEKSNPDTNETLPRLEPTNESAPSSSASPTTTASSEGSAAVSLDLNSLLQAAAAQAEPPKEISPPLLQMTNHTSPAMNLQDAATIFHLLQQSQQGYLMQATARAQYQQQQQQHLQQQLQQQQQLHQLAPSTPVQPAQQPERKRSYPCTFQFCVICQKDVHSSKLPCHIRQCHVAKPMFQCPSCDFTSTYSKNNVKSHMVSLHGLAGDPISYMDRYAPQVEEFMRLCFPNVRGRGRPMQGRASPRSPASPQLQAAVARRNSQAALLRRQSTVREQQEQLLLQLAQQQQAALMAQSQGLSQFSLFPALFNSQLANQLIASNTPTPSLTPATSQQQSQQQVVNNNNNNSSEEKPDKHVDSSSVETVDKTPSLDHIIKKMEQNYFENGSNPSSDEDPDFSDSSPTTIGSVRNAEDIARMAEDPQPRYVEVDPRLSHYTIIAPQHAVETIFERTDMGDWMRVVPVETRRNSIPESGLTNQQRQKLIEVMNIINSSNPEQMDNVIRAIDTFTGIDLITLDDLLKIKDVIPSPVDTIAIIQNLPTLGFSERPEDKILHKMVMVNRLQQKYDTLVSMITFDTAAAEANEKLNTLMETITLVRHSVPLGEMILMVHRLLNALIHEGALPGFMVRELPLICEFKMDDGVSLLDILAREVASRGEAVKTELFDSMLPLCTRAKDATIVSIMERLYSIHLGIKRMESEIVAQGEDNINEPLVHLLLERRSFLPLFNVRAEEMKKNLIELYQYMAEPIPFILPAGLPVEFFGHLADFLEKLRDRIAVLPASV